MTIRFNSAFSLLIYLASLSNPALAEPVRSDNDMSGPLPLSSARQSAPVKSDAAVDSVPDTLAGLNHDAITAYKEHKYSVAQELLNKVISGLEQEKGSDLTLCEALENLHLTLSAQEKTKESDEILARARSIRQKFHLSSPAQKPVEILPTASIRQQDTAKVKETVAIAEGQDPLYTPDKLRHKSLESWSGLMILAQQERDIGEYKKAALDFRKALAIAATLAAPGDKVISSMNSLAGTYRNQDRPRSARILYLACLNLHEKAGKPKDADYATLLDNAGQTCVLLHEYTEAEKMLERAAEIFKTASREPGADLAMTMCNLGEVYLALKKEDKGEQIIAEALAIFKKTLKPEDMRVLITAENLAEIYSRHGKQKEAEAVQKSVIATMEKVVGKGAHPDLCLALNNLAQTLCQEKKFAEAEPLLKRCIDMNKAIYGEKSPRTLHAIGAYARFLEKSGRKEEADNLLKPVTAPY